MDHFVLVGLNVFKDVFTFEVLDCEEGSVEGDSDLVENWNQRLTDWKRGRGMRAAGCQAVTPDPIHLRTIGSGMMGVVTGWTLTIRNESPL